MAHTYYDAPFGLKHRVHIDGDASITAKVTALLWRNENAQAECSWIQDGQSRVAWIEVWRLTSAEPPKDGETDDDRLPF